MKGKKIQKYANIHQQFKPLPPAPLKKLNGIKTSTLNTGKELPYMQLEKVIGLSSKTNSSLAVNPINGEIATTAGCIICIYNPKENKQTKFLFSRLQRSFSCLTFSHNGRYLAAGEGAFRQPEITIWEISLDGQYTEIKHLKGHKYGIESIMFSPNLCYLISLGDANDRGLFVWDWENEQRVTSNKLGKPVNTFAFAQDGTYFVTAGYQHLKYWYFDDDGKVMKSDTNSAASKESIMESKTADMTKVLVKVFVGVASHNLLVYALAQDGHLYVYDKLRALKKWMNIKVEKAYTCSLSNGYMFCGCSDGFIRVFAAETLSHKVTFPKPPPLGSANIESGVKKIRIPSSKESKFADITGVIIDEVNKRAIVLYSDRMMFIWDIKEMEKITVFKSNMYHCGPIHDLQYLPNSIDLGYKDENSAVNLQDEQALTKFMTCSSDRTIRFWHFIDPTASSQNQQQITQGLVKNAYCKDMSRMIYVNSENRDHSVGQFDHFKIKNNRLKEDGTMVDQATLSPDDKDIEQQVRCVRMSPDGKHVACGDWTGNIRVHDVKTLDEIQCIQAHESEVLCLDYSPIIDLQAGGNSQQNTSDNQQQLQLTSSIKYWLASGSRDRLTQIYELSQESGTYENVTILEDHSSTLTSLKFAEETSTKNQKRLKLISTGADKQIVLRNIDLNIVQQNDVKKLQNMVTEDFLVVQKKEQCKYKSFCMEIAQQAGYIVTGHDRFIQMFSLSNCDKVMEKRIESSRKSGSMDQIRVLTDTNAGVVISSSTDKYVTVYEAATGNVICKTTCGEVTTAMCLSTNMKHLITTSTDGIIYVWRLPENLAKALQILKQEQKKKEALIIEEGDDQASRGISMATDLHQQQLAVQQPYADDDFNDLENIAGIQSIGQIEKKVGGISLPPTTSNQQDLNKLDPLRMSEVLAQISKATDKIDKIQIQPRKKIDEEEEEEEFDFGAGGSGHDVKDEQANAKMEQIQTSGLNSLESSQSNSKKNRNNWGNKKDHQTPTDYGHQNTQDMTFEQQQERLREMKVKENKLPRWAQSVSGDIYNQENNERTTLAQKNKGGLDDIKNQIMQQLEASDGNQGSSDDIEEVFSNTLDKAYNQEENQKIVEQKAQELNQKTVVASGDKGGVGMHSHVASNQGVPKNAFYDRIEEDLDEDKRSNEDSKSQQDQEEDEEEKQIKEQLQRRQYHKSRILLGLDDEEDLTPGGAPGSDRRIRMRNNESRTSLSQQFFQRKLVGASSEQNLFRGQGLHEISPLQQPSQQQNKREVLKVEDLFNEDDDNERESKSKNQVISRNNQPSKVLQQSQSQFINQGPQLVKSQVESAQIKPGQTFSKPLADTNQQQSQSKQKVDLDLDLLSQQQDLKRLAQDKYESHKKLIEEEFKKKQRDIEEKARKDKEEMENQHALRRSQLEIKQKEKLNEMDVGSKPNIQILEEIESDIKREEEKLVIKNKSALGGNEKQQHLNFKQFEQKSHSNSRQSPRYENLNTGDRNSTRNDDQMIEEESIVQIRSQNKNTMSNQVNEAAVNATIKAEMDKINNSLAKITQCLNNTGPATSLSSAVRVRDDVTESLGRSISLWNSMMTSLSNRTSINVNLLQSQQMSSFGQSGIDNSSMVNQSFLSQVSVKDDARDLLQKYSELLIEEIAKKLNK